MKRKAAFLLCILLLTSILTGFSETDSDMILTEALSDQAAVRLFSEYGDTHLFAYTDETTYILKTDRSAECTTVYPASAVFLRGDSVTAFCPMEELLAIQRFRADTLTETDFYGISVPAEDLLYLDTDAFGRSYAVLRSDPDTLHIYDAAGSRVQDLSYAAPIQRIQVLEDDLFVFFAEYTLCIPLTEALPQSSAFRFTYPASAAPFHMLTADTYVNTEGDICSVDGQTLLNTGYYILQKNCLAAAGDRFYWASGTDQVTRYDSGDAAACMLPGTVEALTAAAAIVRKDDRYLQVPYGVFEVILPESTPTPAPSPSAAPTPSASPAPESVGVTFAGMHLYAPAGLTAAALKNALEPLEAEVYTETAQNAAGKLRTNWYVSVENTVYTVIVPGDINSSGTVNSMDLRLLQRFLVGMDTPTAAQTLAADLNGNGRLGVSDLVLLSIRIA